MRSQVTEGSDGVTKFRQLCPAQLSFCFKQLLYQMDGWVDSNVAEKSRDFVSANERTSGLTPRWSGAESVHVSLCAEVKKEAEEGDEPRAETESESEEELSCFAPTVRLENEFLKDGRLCCECFLLSCLCRTPSKQQVVLLRSTDDSLARLFQREC